MSKQNKHNRYAHFAGAFFLLIWVVINLILFSGEADISVTRISNWPLFLVFTAGFYVIPYTIARLFLLLVAYLRNR